MRCSKHWDRIAGVVSCLLLVGAAADRCSLAAPIDPGPYHGRITAAAKEVRWSQGDWTAVEDTDAEKVGSWIRANVFMSRHMTNAVTGHAADLLIEQCNDARDLIPHFPAVCYPGRGMTQTGIWNRDWHVGDLTIHGTEYLFDTSTFRAGGSIVVDNFMILPTGDFCRDMKEVKRKLPIADRYLGIGQFQVVFPADLPQSEREADLREILRPCHDLIAAILKG